MNCCCNDIAPATPPPSQKPASWLRRFFAIFQWAIPLATLALVPKCPACVAAYVFLFTGIGLSFQTATMLRWGLIALSVVPLAYLVFNTVRAALARCLV